MKVGILTFHHATNYGAVWQCLSLSQAVRSLGHDVEVIGFRHPLAEKNYRDHLLRSRHAPFNLLKAWRLSRDLRQGTKLSSTCHNPGDLRNVASRYDAVIVGSDEVWNIEGMRGWTPAYFLDFVPDHVRKISYAASTGHKISATKHAAELKRLLARFDAISVRDATSADVVEGWTSNRPQVVVDPTLLPSHQLLEPTWDHVALYGGLARSSKQWLRRVASKRGIQVISVGFSNRVGGRIRIQADLEEWLQTIGSARLVITTTFHGVMAAITQRRPFWVLPRMDGATKVFDFLSAYGLLHRSLDPNNLPDHLDFEQEINYPGLWRALEEDQRLSLNFLASSLEGA